MACYEDGGAMTLRDVGNVTKTYNPNKHPDDERDTRMEGLYCYMIQYVWRLTAFLTRCGMDDLSMTCYEDGWSMTLCDVGGLANQPDGMPPCRDAMPRVFSPLGFNINFTLNTWF